MAAVTIADLIGDRRLLWVYCRDCGRERDVDPATLPLPGDLPVPEVGQRMRCSTCGSRQVHTAPELYPGGDAREVGRSPRVGKNKAAAPWESGLALDWH